MKWRMTPGQGIQGGTFLRLLFFMAIFGVGVGIILPVTLEKLNEVDQRKAQKRAEGIVEQAARWYLINNGSPAEVMNTEDVKKVLIPHYLNRWPGKKIIECRIDTEGNIFVWTNK